MIPALVLTAGLATRLRPLSLVRAKAAVPVAGEPLVRRILRQLAAAGVADVVLNLHYLPHTLTAIVGDGSDLGVRVRYSWETPVLGSAGGVRHALDLLRSSSSLLPSSSFFVINGDTLTDVDLAELLSAHRRTDALVTMAVVPNTEPERYGGVLVDADDAVTGFARRGASAHSYHFVGVQIAEVTAFASLIDGVPTESVGSLYPSLIEARRGAVRAHVCAAAFLDIGTPADYLQTSLGVAAREGRVPTLGARVRIDPTARVERTVLWDDVDVGAGVLLRECVVTDGVHVPADTSWTGVTLRLAGGELAPGERRIDGLAIASI
ncbi:MAG: NDP-sugar synthase [Acidobacteria bacterium]|nr:NDP-sugar synthase [Acidobacteriota bacterium]